MQDPSTQLPTREETEAALNKIINDLQRNTARRMEIESQIATLQSESKVLAQEHTDTEAEQRHLRRVLSQIEEVERVTLVEQAKPEMEAYVKNLRPYQRLALVAALQDTTPPEGSGNENLNRPISHLELSKRAYNCLFYYRSSHENTEIRYIGDLVQFSEAQLLRVKNFGRKSLKEVKEVLREMGLRLGMQLVGWVRPK